MKTLGKWIGGGIGWAMAGPIGAIIGFVFGAFFDNSQKNTFEKHQTLEGDFNISLMVLLASVMKIDGRVVKLELEFVKQFLRKYYSIEQTKQYLLILKESLSRIEDISSICSQINKNMQYHEKLQLISLLIEVAKSDKQYLESERKIIEKIGYMIGVENIDFNYSYDTYTVNDNSVNYYQILEVNESSTNEEIKKSYRKLVKMYHPDAVSNLGEAVKKESEEKFKKIQEAYTIISKERGI